MLEVQSVQRPFPKIRLLILRIYEDERGDWHGQIDNPGDTSRTPFSGASELLEQLAALLAERPDSNWSDPCER